ncbi:Retrovirus-related Pol polyprotein [Stylophora pistillata]|uniref:Retrovirus-related Pol polyprotein n=1 Tax=Stylophora pistillata TaxID=50429 RepID=A0A2B4SNE2_STYPI|nr:Retrovirus-related Pol polyprotein [Stylophora pistillata]
MKEDRQIQRRYLKKRNRKDFPNRPVSIVVVNNVMKEEQSVPRSTKRAASIKKYAILRLFADHQRRYNISKKTRTTVWMKAVCKWKLSLVQTKAKQWLADIEFCKSAKEDYIYCKTTTLACQLHTGATCNVMSWDDLSAITQLGDPPMNTSSVKLKLFWRYNFKARCVPENVRQMSETPPQKSLSKEELLTTYHEVFTRLGHIGDAKIMVDPNFKPVQHSPRCVPVALQKEVKNKILELEEKGIIKKAVEPSEWISSMLIVAKPQKIRICLHPKDLNRAIQCPKFEMPTLEELLPDLNKARIFSSFDAKDGFYQVGLDQESSRLTTFWTPLGGYRYLRMPFGINLAPEVFESRLQECLANLPGVKVIRDNILVVGYGENHSEALLNNDQNVVRLLERAKQGWTETRWVLTQHPVLKFYSIEEEVTIQTDASIKGLGAVLLQNGQPVAFAFRTLSPIEQSYTTIEKECLGIVFACERFNQHQARREQISVETDHKPLESIFKKSLLSAPCHLQRMLLRLQRFNLTVKYKPGSQMLLADHLSRAAQHETSEPEESFQVFFLELESLDPMQTLKVMPERLNQLQSSTSHDDTLQTLKTTILTGWPMQKDQVPIQIREYWSYADELSVHYGVHFKGSRVVIPMLLKPEVKSRIHSSHLGVEVSLRKARDAVFWPGMNAEVNDLIKQCSICNEFQVKNQKLPMQSHELPDRPWGRVAVDQFKLHGKKYIVLVDYYSDFLEVQRLEENTSGSVIEFFKEQFS